MEYFEIGLLILFFAWVLAGLAWATSVARSGKGPIRPRVNRKDKTS